MTTKENGEIVRAVYSAFDDKDIAAFDALCEPGAKMTSYGFDQTVPLHDYMQNWMTGFPDGKVELVNVIAGEEWCAAEFIGRGTHTGALNTPEGALEATNRPVEIRMCELLCIRNGKVQESRSYFDATSFLAQLGEEATVTQRAESPAWQTEEQPVIH